MGKRENIPFLRLQMSQALWTRRFLLFCKELDSMSLLSSSADDIRQRGDRRGLRVEEVFMEGG